MESTTCTLDHDTDYGPLLESVANSFAKLTQEPGTKLFTTDVTGLFTAYLDELPQELRQEHTCNCCRNFVERFGGLVRINEQGQIRTVMWDNVPPGIYQSSFERMQKLVERAKVTGVFHSDEKTWGTAKTGAWSHLSITPAKHLLHDSRALLPHQAEAERAEDFKTMVKALKEFDLQTVTTAVTLLESEALYRSEKTLGVAKWLQELITRRNATKDSRSRANQLWLAVATAPAGFAHPRSSMIGTLLEDIADGLAYEDVRNKFSAKMNPTKYMRPQSDPTAGATASAERLVEKLGVAAAFERRFARLEELQTIWKPAAVKSVSGTGVFTAVKPKGAEARALVNGRASQALTWAKFARTIMPQADKIELYVPEVGSFSAFLTAVDGAAPPIIQWDSEEARNPLTWYVYRNGSPASRWGLIPGTWTNVTALSEQPNLWQAGFKHQGEGVLFVLDGAKDDRSVGAGNNLFPELLKSELHGARKVIEAFSKTAKVHGFTNASACGYLFQKNISSFSRNRIRVTTQGTAIEYSLDRWD